MKVYINVAASQGLVRPWRWSSARPLTANLSSGTSTAPSTRRWRAPSSLIHR